MKTAEAKTVSPTIQRKAAKPFFGKGNESFFGNEAMAEQSSFFPASKATTSSGNQTSIQAKLTIGQPNDKYEQEADAMADKVVQRLAMPEVQTKREAIVQAKPLAAGITPLVQAKCDACEQEEKLQKKEDKVEEENEKVQLKPIFETEAKPEIQKKTVLSEITSSNHAKDDVQQKAVTNSALAATKSNVVQTKCATCEKEEKLSEKEEENSEETLRKVQRKPIFEGNAEPPEDENNLQRKCAACEKEEKLQTKSGLSAETTAPTDIESSLQSSKGSGSAMAAGTKEQMENSFGTDFSRVRIHTDSTAVQMSKGLNAQAFTHGSDIYFNSGKYDTNSTAGKHLLAHELTHTVQQGAVLREIQKSSLSINNYTTVPNIQRLAPLIGIGVGLLGRYLVGKGVRWGIRKIFEEDDTKTVEECLEELKKQLREIPIDIKGMNVFQPTFILKDYIQSYYYVSEFLKTYGYPSELIDLFSKGPKVNVRYGSMGKVNGVRIRWDVNTDTYNAGPFQMSLVHKDFDFFDKGEKTLGMNVRISSSLINGEVGVAPIGQFFQHLANSTLHDTPVEFIFDSNLLQEALLGTDSDKATAILTYGILSGGYIDILYTGWTDIGNFQSIDATYHFQDGQDKSEWAASTDLDVMGMEPFKLNILRTAKGILSGIMGDGEKILFAASLKEKGFEASTEVKASYLNQTLIIQGTGSFKTVRAQGDLFFIVTDYATAKSHALGFLTDLEATGPVEEGPPNPTEKLAFMASGNLTIVLFDGSRETRTRSLLKKAKGLVMDKPSPGDTTIPSLKASASFVVEPEGFITVAGQIKPVAEYFDLTAAQTYEPDPIKIADIPLGTLPLPYGLGIGFDFTAEAFANAHLSPIRLSEIFAEGVYSTNPRFASELNLGAKLSVEGGIKAGIRFCLNITAEALGGLITITVLKKCIEGSVGINAAIQAEPSIQIKKSAPDDNSAAPPEYFIKGDLHLNAGARLAANLGDTLSIKVQDEESDDKKSAKPLKTWYYKNTERTKEKEFGNGDIVAPVDLTLGKGEPPPIAVPAFTKRGTWVILDSILRRGNKLSNYFEETASTASAPTAPAGPAQNADVDAAKGGFSENGEEKGELIKKSEKTDDEQTVYTFSERFSMLNNAHQLILNITQNRKFVTPPVSSTPGAPQQASPVQLTAESQLIMQSESEPLAEKIEEEQQEITAAIPGVDTSIRQQDLAVIKQEGTNVIADANELGVNDQLTNETHIGGLKEIAEAASKYGSRFNKPDLGVPEIIPEPLCQKPVLNQEDVVFFPNSKDTNKMGKVIEIKKEPLLDTKTKKTVGNQWMIVFKPSGKRTTNLVIRQAYDFNDCSKPAFMRVEPEGCENSKPAPPETIPVPARTINGKNYPATNKAHKVKLMPLCIGQEQEPDAHLVGWVRIDKKFRKRWHRTHLIHGKMGGPGASWNLVPAPQQVNNGEMRSRVENPLLGFVIKGLHNGNFYWFKATVVYHEPGENGVIGHFEDFVKQLDISYGEATKDADGKWQEGKTIFNGSISNGFVGEPDSDELAVDRRRG